MLSEWKTQSNKEDTSLHHLILCPLLCYRFQSTSRTLHHGQCSGRSLSLVRKMNCIKAAVKQKDHDEQEKIKKNVAFGYNLELFSSIGTKKKKEDQKCTAVLD